MDDYSRRMEMELKIEMRKMEMEDEWKKVMQASETEKLMKAVPALLKGLSKDMSRKIIEKECKNEAMRLLILCASGLDERDDWIKVRNEFAVSIETSLAGEVIEYLGNSSEEVTSRMISELSYNKDEIGLNDLFDHCLENLKDEKLGAAIKSLLKAGLNTNLANKDGERPLRRLVKKANVTTQVNDKLAEAFMELARAGRGSEDLELHKPSARLELRGSAWDGMLNTLYEGEVLSGAAQSGGKSQRRKI